MSAAGRPKKPVLLKALEGDTRQRGANKHAEAIASALISQRGEPDMPLWEAPEDADPAVHRRLQVAREHWLYLCRELSREGLLSTVDQGMLATAATTYAMAQESFLMGDVRAHTEQSRTYMQIADRMGLNESARAKFPKKAEKMDELEAALCG